MKNNDEFALSDVRHFKVAMNESEFEQMLAQYPKVRDKTYRKISRHTQAVGDVQTAIRVTPSVSLDVLETKDESVDFFVALKEYLVGKLGEDKGNEAVKLFKSNYENTLKNLSLDDIERLAIRLEKS